jgi:nucleoid-associated protein YgaU
MDIQTKKYNDCKQLADRLSEYNFANLFNVVQLGEKSYFNISKTLTFDNIQDIPEQYYTLYELTESDTWTGISYTHYGTISLWWLICKFNGIVNPFIEITPGKVIMIPNKKLVDSILIMLHNG